MIAASEPERGGIGPAKVRQLADKKAILDKLTRVITAGCGAEQRHNQQCDDLWLRRSDRRKHVRVAAGGHGNAAVGARVSIIQG
ncbi:MAG TPA: hypothetical protein VFW65_12185 [Pseudonocardiaceae bacterium]|nr:hypothetical protein [Pseudonocardiaceae bacterium]